MKRIVLAALILVTALVNTTVKAQTTNILRISGITGSSTVFHHQNDIDIGTFSWGVDAPALLGSGAVKPTFTDFTITKRVDMTSPTIVAKCVTAEAIPGASIFVVGASPAAGGYDIFRITLTGVVITSVKSAPPDIDGSPMETITIHCTQTYNWTFTPLNSNGTLGTPITTTYTVSTGA